MSSGIWEVVGTLYVDKRLWHPWSLASAKILEPSPFCNVPLGLVSLESGNEYPITKEAKSLCPASAASCLENSVQGTQPL